MDEFVYSLSRLLQTTKAGDVSSLSVAQDKTLSITPIFSATLSIWGSANIICMVVGSDKKTPYRRILLGMSICDIISSVAFALQGFLMPQDTSQRALAIGNDASCEAMGFLSQLSFSNFWYNSCLSFYFLLTVKYGIRETDVGRKYEPWMHLLSICFPLVTASVGAGLGVYDELYVGHGCWVTNYPKGCGCKEGEEGECCLSPMIAWIFGGIPVMVALFSVLINNLLVYFHVRYTIKKSMGYGREFSESALRASRKSMDMRTSRKSTRSSTIPENSGVIENNDATDLNTALDELEARSSNHSIASITSSITKRLSMFRQQDPKVQRIRAVATQAFLYVGAFLLTQAPAVILRIMDSQNALHPADEAQFFPLLLIQAIFFPLQGLFNLLIYCRPSFIRARADFPNETRIWAFRRALHGPKILPRRREIKSRQQTNHQQTIDEQIVDPAKVDPQTVDPPTNDQLNIDDDNDDDEPDFYE